MASLAKVYDDGKIGPTSCCKAPMDQDGSENGDIFYICQGCGEQVTLVPELPEMSPVEKAAYNLAKAHNANAGHVNEDAVAHVARILHSEILELVMEVSEEEIPYILEMDINMDPLVYSVVKSWNVDIKSDGAIELLSAHLLLNKKFWRDCILPKCIDPMLERTGFQRHEVSSFLAHLWVQDGGTNKIVEEVMNDV